MVAKWEPSDADDVVKDYTVREMTPQEIGLKHGVSATPVIRLLRARGVAIRDRSAAHMGRPLKPLSGVVERYRAGETMVDLAAAYSVSRQTIKARLVEAGEPLRDSSTVQQINASRRSPEENRRIVAAAHDAKRGRSNSMDALCRAAATRERRGVGVSPAETLFAGWLAERGVETIPQKAIGPFNCDLGADPVAVEVFGGNWHATGHHARTFPDRANYLLDRGWHLLVVWNQTRDPISPFAADYAVTFIERARRDPPLVGEYRVIRGCGQEIARGEGQFDHLALVPSQRRT